MASSVLRWTLPALFAVGASGCVATVERLPAPDYPMRWSFDDQQAGQFTTTTRRSGSWVVRPRPDGQVDRNALCATAVSTARMLRLSPFVYADVRLTARLRMPDETIVQESGLLLRLQSTKSGYLLRINSGRDTIAWDKLENGQRTLLRKAPLPVMAGEWRELQAEARGGALTGSVNGWKLIEAQDASYDSGQVGVWTQADTPSCYLDIGADPP